MNDDSDYTDDDELFRRAMDGVQPLDHRKEPPRRKKPAPRARFTRAEERDVLWESLHGALDPADIESGDELSYRRPGIQPGVLKKLRRGRYRVEDELDLHGLIVPDAARVLREFVQDRSQAGVRCIRVIHGKGKRSGHKGPVLKPKVARWLRNMDAVLAYATSTPADGGTGAVYVLLRNPRR